MAMPRKVRTNRGALLSYSMRFHELKDFVRLRFSHC